MKKFCMLSAVLLLLLAICIPALAQATAVCNGNLCGGNGARNWTYNVSGVQYPFTMFSVGTDAPGGYNWLMPEGWTYHIVSGQPVDNKVFSPHGDIVPYTGTCKYIIQWTGPEIMSGVFGYDLRAEPHEVDWSTPQVTNADYADWSAAIGMGDGPVHGPLVPEPGSLFVLSSGIIGLVGMIRRRK